MLQERRPIDKLIARHCAEAPSMLTTRHPLPRQSTTPSDFYTNVFSNPRLQSALFFVP